MKVSNMNTRYLFVLLCIWCFVTSARAEFISATVAAGFSAAIAGALAGFNVLRCLRHECCTDRWISNNFTAELSKTLDASLFGQHLVMSPVVKLLKAHSKGNPSKALTLSFHGWTGTGKNYVSKLIVEAMYTMGMKSRYVHLISATKEFPHQEMVSLYKDKLRDIIETGVAECERSVFIIDEMDKMPKGLIDTLKPYLDFYETIGGLDYRKAIFFFLSNTAGNDIALHTINHWKKSKPREDITLKEMEKVIRLPALNTENGLWHSDLITKNLISAYIPFMPLERSHVKQCIRAGLITKGYFLNEAEITEVKVQEIADELQYYPDSIQIFSTTGCKRIHEKIDYIMEEL